MKVFKKFDFDGPFQDANEKWKEILLAVYKSKISASDFIDKVLGAKIRSRGGKASQRRYRKVKTIYDQYKKLDDKFNFFGNYEEN